MYCAGIFISPMVTLCGCRVTSFAGSFIVAFAFLISFAAVEVWHLYLTYGLLAGTYPVQCIARFAVKAGHNTHYALRLI